MARTAKKDQTIISLATVPAVKFNANEEAGTRAGTLLAADFNIDTQVSLPEGWTFEQIGRWAVTEWSLARCAKENKWHPDTKAATVAKDVKRYRVEIREKDLRIISRAAYRAASTASYVAVLTDPQLDEMLSEQGYTVID